MTSILSTPGKYRSRKDLSTGSIPTLVSLEEESSLHTITGAESELPHSFHLQPLTSPNGSSAGSTTNGNYEPFGNTLNIKNGLNAKSPRRSSLAIGLLGGRTNGSGDKGNKRRSSIAVAFLGAGRRDSKSHSHHYPIATIPEKYHKTTESDIENDSPIHYYTCPPGSVPTLLEPNGSSEFGGSNGNLTVNGSGYDKKRRRSSSWQTKLERRRRKGMMSSALDGVEGAAAGGLDGFGSANGLDVFPGKYGREKRHSWWNIFVPDNLKQRTRRASQDVILSKSSDSLSPPYRRSKSRSVDHGLAAPFDLDSLRSKVEGRFESIDRLTKDGEKKRSMPTIPTTSYTVGDRDTLTSVAARFDTTPSELTQLNRLGSSFIYSGQQLLVPDKTAKPGPGSTGDGDSDASTERSSHSPTEGRRRGSNEDLSQDEKDLLEGLRPGSPKPGHIERVATPNNQSGGGGGGDTAAGFNVVTKVDEEVNVKHFDPPKKPKHKKHAYTNHHEEATLRMTHPSFGAAPVHVAR